MAQEPYHYRLMADVVEFLSVEGLGKIIIIIIVCIPS